MLSFTAHPSGEVENESTWFILVSDLTEDTSARKRLSLLEHSFEAAQDVILIAEAEPIDLAHGGPRVIDVNPAFEKMTGYKAEEIIGKTPRILQGAKTDRHELDKIRQALENWESVEAELTNYRKDGTEFHVHLMISPIADENGWFTHWVAIQRDITEKKKYQAELEKLARRYQVASEAGAIGTWEFNVVDNHLVWDKQMREIYGVSEDQFSSDFEAWASSVHPDDLEAAQAELGFALEGTKEFDTVFRIVKRGEIRHIVGKAIVSRHEDGSPYLVTGINVDITDQKKIEDENNLLKSVAANGKDAVIITEAEPITKEEGGPKILYVNPSFCEMTGYSPEEIIGKTPRVMQGPKTDRETLNILRASLEKWEPVEVELINYKKSGEEYWANISITPIADESGWYTHWVSIERDVTERKKEELALIEAKEIAENASRSKSEFLSTMSHEIRTPLNAVIGMAGLLEETSLDKEQVSFVRTIKQGGDTLLSVINDILDYSKIEAGKVELEEETFALTQPIEDTLELLAGKAYHKGIELMYALGMNLPEIVKGDITRLRQILVNLVSNAIKFTEEGEILVSVKQERINDDWITLKFSVKDTGVGIPKEKISSLFDAFSQVDASTTRKYGGTGLGLAICKRLVRLQGGDIWAESKLGMGTTFHFTVMLKKTESAPVQVIGKPQLSGKTIVLLDDNHTNLEIIERQLQPFGIQVISFSSPHVFLEWAETAQRPDLLIIDYHMPHITGLEVSRRLRTNLQMVGIPTILMTSAVDISSQELKDEFDSIIQKPYRKAAVIEAIESLLTSTEKADKTNANKAKKPIVDLSGIHILLTEDNLTNQKVARKMLEKTNACVTVANNGQEAIDALSLRTFDLILMDVQMPVMDGLEATRKIRQLPLLHHTPIIALTANASKADRENCLDAGMDDYLTKPIRKETLYNMLSRYLKRDLSPSE